MMNETKPLITWDEILRRAHMSIKAELYTLDRVARESGLPLDCYSADRAALDAKLMAIDTMMEMTGVEK